MILEDDRAEVEFLEDLVMDDEMTGITKVELGGVLDAGANAEEDDRAEIEEIKDERDVAIDGEDVVIGAKELVIGKGGPLMG